jgi:hypothetical protein
MAMGTVLALISLVMLTFLTMTNLSVSAMRLTANGRDKAISLSLAEAGVDYAVDQIRASAQSNYDNNGDIYNSWTGTGGAMTLNNAAGVPTGTFSVTAANVAGNRNEIDVISTGTTPNQKVRQVRTRIAINGISFDGGAMLSNGAIRISGSVDVQTASGPAGNADVRANGNITTNGNPSVDGAVMAAGTVDPRWPDGISGAPRIDFPNASDIAKMEEDFAARAKAGGTQDVAWVRSEMLAGRSINGPLYVTGDLTLNSGEILRLAGKGPIFFAGNVDLRAQSTLVNGMTGAADVVVGGWFKQRGGSTFAANPVSGKAPPGLFSMSTSNEAIELNGNSSNDQYGVVYAVKGGITVGGNTEVRGSLVAGSEISMIDATGNYTHYYYNQSLNDKPFLISPAVKSWIEM